MNDLSLCGAQFDSEGWWMNPISMDHMPDPSWVELFDQNGYDLSVIEIMYAQVNQGQHSEHRNHTHVAIKQPWFTQPCKLSGSVLNHSLLFERKGYQGAALEQLQRWAQQMPLLQKVIQLRPKWGLDFSMDWADDQGNVFEILHHEFDTFDLTEAEHMKAQLEPVFSGMDWDHAAQALLSRKHEWHDLGFFEQSDYKCNFFGIPKERFKMVAWA